MSLAHRCKWCPADSGAQRLVSLSSVEDDALGEELQVIWEIEPGAQVIEKAALPEPTGFDPLSFLQRGLDYRDQGRRRRQNLIPGQDARNPNPECHVAVTLLAYPR
jgi:hypothetical protein